MLSNTSLLIKKQPLWIPIVVLGSFLLFALAYQLYSSVKSYQRIVPLHQHMGHLDRLQSILSNIEISLAGQLPENRTLSTAGRQVIAQSLHKLVKQGGSLAPSTTSNLAKVWRLLDNRNEPARETLLKILTELRKIYVQETVEHKKLTQSLQNVARSEIWLGLLMLIMLPLAALIILFLMRRRILNPLKQMGELMQLLSKQQYQLIPEEHIDSSFQPLVNNYNAMVKRLSMLENEHLEYEHKLEQQVEHVARTLIEQQQSLSNSEKLAILGEMTARLAHEIRNPLAGIKMACANLQADESLSDEVKARITLVSEEIDRINLLINDLLEQGQHEPEPLVKINIKESLDDLSKLALYLIPSHIKLNTHIAPKLICNLPEIQLRQAVLNLIINAQQAMEDKEGVITLEAHNHNDENILIISVCDQGTGFTEQLLTQGIQAFRTDKQGGTGLGLSMVKRFVRNLDGELLISNQAPQGACVTIKLPCNN